MKFEISSTIDNIPKDDWDRLFKDEPIEGWGYYKAFEESGIKEFNLSYLIAKRGQNISAIIPFFISDFSFDAIITGPLQKIILSVQKIFKRFLKLRVLFVGSPTTERMHIGIAEGENTEELISGALREFSNFKRISALLFYNLCETHKEIGKILKNKGFARSMSLPNTFIDINATSLEEYLSRLSKNTRKDLTRRLKKTASLANLATDVLEKPDGCLNRIHQLYSNNLNESEIRFETLTPDFFKNVSQRMKEKVKYFITRDKDKIVAFNLCFVNKDTCIDKFIGFDNEVSHALNLYHYTFCHNIDWCIKNGVRYYQMGVTDYYPKLRLGAKLMPLDVYFRFSSALLKPFAGLIAKFSSPVNFDPALKKYEKEKGKLIYD